MAWLWPMLPVFLSLAGILGFRLGVCYSSRNEKRQKRFAELVDPDNRSNPDSSRGSILPYPSPFTPGDTGDDRPSSSSWPRASVSCRARGSTSDGPALCAPRVPVSSSWRPSERESVGDDGPNGGGGVHGPMTELWDAPLGAPPTYNHESSLEAPDGPVPPGGGHGSEAHQTPVPGHDADISCTPPSNVHPAMAPATLRDAAPAADGAVPASEAHKPNEGPALGRPGSNGPPSIIAPRRSTVDRGSMPGRRTSFRLNTPNPPERTHSHPPAQAGSGPPPPVDEERFNWQVRPGQYVWKSFGRSNNVAVNFGQHGTTPSIPLVVDDNLVQRSRGTTREGADEVFKSTFSKLRSVGLVVADVLTRSREPSRNSRRSYNSRHTSIAEAGTSDAPSARSRMSARQSQSALLVEKT